jgi:hypothetical protein
MTVNQNFRKYSKESCTQKMKINIAMKGKELLNLKRREDG